MPNRIIKETICTSEDLDKLSQGAEILFYRLIVKCDDYGRYHANSSIVKSTCFPLKSDAIKCKQVESWLSELVNAGLIIVYQAEDERQYLQFTKWEKHQQIRAKKPKFPTFDSNCNQLFSSGSKCPRNPNQSNPNEGENAHSHKYGKYGWVRLTDKEYNTLLEELGRTELDRCIAYVDDSAEKTKNRNGWRSWIAVIRNCHSKGWGLSDAKKTGQKQGEKQEEANPDLSWRQERYHAPEDGGAAV